jgi:glycosyltransferase involved in cell wall biosynthesis
MKMFAREGNKVLYVEAQSSILSFNAITSDWGRVFRWLKGPRHVEKNLYVATLPLVLPFFQMSVVINQINNWFILKILLHWIKKLNFHNPILWTYNPYNESLVGKLGEKLSIYGCVDELSASKGLVRSQVVSYLEKRLIKKVDIVIVTHENLYKSKKALAKGIYLIPNGADIEHFSSATLPTTPIASEMKDIPKPIIGYLGTIQYWIDLELVRYLAVSRPKWSIVLIGPVGRLAKIGKIKDVPNVYLLGRKDYATLPSYLKACDICMNPYVIDGIAKNCSPLKLYEYLATGKPIVSVDMPEARRFEAIVEIADDYEDFLKKTEKIFNSLPEDIAKKEARIKAVERDSWEARFLELNRILAIYLERI